MIADSAFLFVARAEILHNDSKTSKSHHDLSTCLQVATGGANFSRLLVEQEYTLCSQLFALIATYYCGAPQLPVEKRVFTNPPNKKVDTSFLHAWQEKDPLNETIFPESMTFGSFPSPQTCTCS